MPVPIPYEQAVASVSQIAASERASTGWLEDPADFDFRADLEAIAANSRRDANASPAKIDRRIASGGH